MSKRPAEILKLGPEFGQIEKGQQANLTIVDVDHDWTLAKSDFASKSVNSCFLKRNLKGKIMATVCAGKLWKFS